MARQNVFVRVGPHIWMMNMNFREALLRLSSDTGALSRTIGGFNAREARLLLAIPTKQASNYLRRLHHMGFLKRRKTRRLCVWSKRFTTDSKACYRGYMFTYSFSRQGVSYLNWLRSTKPAEDILYSQLTYDVVSSLPEEVKKRVLRLTAVRASFKYRGPTRNLRIFDNDAVPVAELVHQNQVLADENKKLALDNAVLSTKLNSDAVQNEQSKRTLNQYLATTILEAAKIKNEMERWRETDASHRIAFEAARYVLTRIPGFDMEQIKEYLSLLSIHDWIVRNHKEGLVPAEELYNFIASQGLEDAETICWLIENGFLINTGSKLLYAYAGTSSMTPTQNQTPQPEDRHTETAMA